MSGLRLWALSDNRWSGVLVHTTAVPWHQAAARAAATDISWERLNTRLLNSIVSTVWWNPGHCSDVFLIPARLSPVASSSSPQLSQGRITVAINNGTRCMQIKCCWHQGRLSRGAKLQHLNARRFRWWERGRGACCPRETWEDYWIKSQKQIEEEASLVNVSTFGLTDVNKMTDSPRTPINGIIMNPTYSLFSSSVHFYWVELKACKRCCCSQSHSVSLP
jgi:hypothetical protein